MEKFDINKFLLSCEVQLKSKEDFVVIMETLKRIGVANKERNTLFQSCHILHKHDKFYIVHFKEMYALDGKECTMSYGDLARRNLIAKLLENWNLLKIVNPNFDKEPISSLKNICVLSHEEKSKWKLQPKYLFSCFRKK